MNYSVKYVEYLPSVNLSESFLIKEDALASFMDNWLDFCDLFLTTFDKNFIGKQFKTADKYISGSKIFFNLEIPIQEFLGMTNDDFKVFDVEYMNDNSFKYIQKSDYKKLIKFMYTNTKKKFTNKYIMSQMIDKFLMHEWDNKRLLFPATFYIKGYIRKRGWETYTKNNKLLELLEKHLSIYNNSKFFAMPYLLTSTNWDTVGSITEQSIRDIYHYVLKNYQGSSGKKTATLRMTNQIRYFLIDKGREDIAHPKSFILENQNNQTDDLVELDYDSLFEFINHDTYPTHIAVKLKAQEFIKYLYEIDGLTVATLRGYSSCLIHFFNYLVKYYPYQILDTNLVDTIFDINNKNFIKYYIESLDIGSSTKREIISLTARFLDYSKIYTRKAKKNTPTIKSSSSKKTYRDAMPLDMLKDLTDIVKNRPPKRKSYWDKNKADLSWWKHKDVYPVLPIMYLMHLYIPLRGAQIRNLCREKSFVYDSQGNIESFIINTDKNVSRKQLQEIPNVWNELDIFKPFLKWHKEYFPYLKPVVYNRDKNTVWDDITPLMLLHGSITPMNKSAHAAFHKKVLCIYQMELNKKYENGEIEYLPKVAWLGDGKKHNARKVFFQTHAEIDNTTDDYIKGKIKVAYDIHSIRVTGITRYIDAGFALHLVSLLSGHTDVNTMVRVYIKLDKKSLEKKLKSSVDKLNSFTRDELAKAYDENDDSKLEKSFNDNKLFSLHRNSTDSKDYELGINIALQKDPLLYKPMIHGICPAVECPPGREDKCSLCPHLITGELFSQGIAHQANLTFAKFYRQSKELEDEKAKKYTNSARVSHIEMLVEEIMGWHEIINKIETSDENSLIEQKVFESKSVDSNIAYLESAYDAKQLGIERDDYALKLLTIKAIQFASKMNYGDIKEIINDNEKAIDYLLNHYQDYKNKNLLPDFIKEISR